jgi:C_GCAxxG_C_C family probable redox protein
MRLRLSLDNPSEPTRLPTNSLEHLEIMTRKEQAIKLFKNKFNCSQAVFTAYRRQDVLDEQNALKLSTIFGAGVACTGRGQCGAISGALLAISMHHGRGDLASTAAKGATYMLGQQFIAEFKERMGDSACESILGINIGTPENLAKAQELQLFETRCVDAVKAACDILDKIL